MDCNVDAECDKGKTETTTSKQFSFRKNSSASQSNKNKSSTNDSGKVSDPKKSKDSNHIGRYRLVSTLGRGNFAKVKLAVHLTTGLEVAVKVIDKTQLNAVSLKKLFREVDIMKTLNHPNIVKLYEVIESERHVYLVMEYISKGELFDHLVNFGRMKEKIAREKFRQIVSAIQYCHSKKIVHRDLKAENVLVDADTNMKIADFGFANQFGVSGKLDTFCGSPPYAAPELFQGKRYDGPEVDIWSLGVILYTIVSGSLPFDAHNLKELREKVLRGKYRVPYYLSAECEQLLKKMLILNPDKRHSLSSIMSDKWINTGYENDPLKPFIEPTINYNDPVKINIMYRMGFIDADIRETLQSKKFNNIHATYVILDGYKSLKDLPNAAINQGTAYLPVASSPSATAESKLDSSKVSNKSSPSLTNGKSEKDACTNKKYEQASSITGDSKQQEEDKKKTGTLSWMKQSSSAGPGTTTPTTKKNGDKSSKEGLTSSSIAVDDESSENIIKAAHHQHHHRKDKNNLDVNGNDNTLSPLNGGANHLNPSSSSNDTYLVKRNNTFSISDKRTIDDKPLHRATPRLQMNKMPENSFEFNLGEESSYMVNESSDYPNCESDQVRQALLSDPSAKAIVTKTRPATEYNPTMIQKLIRSLSKKKTSNSNNREIESRNVGFNRKDPVRATAPLKQGYNKPRHVSQESLAKDDQAINDTKSITRPENLKHWNGGDINNYVSLAHPEDATVDSSEDASSFQCDKSFLDHSGTMVESVLTAFNKSLCNSSPTNSESKIDPDKYSADVNFDRNNNKHNNTTPSNECTQVELRLHPSDNDGTLKKNGSLHKKHLAVNNGLKQAASPNHKSENNDPWTPMTNSLYQTPDSSESRNLQTPLGNQERISSFGRSVRGPPSTSKRGKNLRNLMSCIRSSREKVDTNETSDEVNDTNLLDDKEKLVSSPKKSKNPLMTTGSKVPLYSFRNYINSQIKSNQFDLLKRAIAQELDSHNISYSRSETGFCCQVTECSTQKIRTNFSILLSRGIISSSYGARFKFESGDDKIFQQTKTVLCQKITQKINTL